MGRSIPDGEDKVLPHKKSQQIDGEKTGYDHDRGGEILAFRRLSLFARFLTLSRCRGFRAFLRKKLYVEDSLQGRRPGKIGIRGRHAAGCHRQKWIPRTAHSTARSISL